MTGLLGQSARFAGAGLVNTAVGLAAIYAVMFFLPNAPALANAIGYLIGFAVSFALHRSWTFGSKAPFSQAVPRFLLLAAICYLLNLGIVLGVLYYFPAKAYFAQACGVAIYAFSFFLGCRLFVFATRQGE